jgi:hypothetical protein
MTTIALRKELRQYIEHADKRFLKMVYAMSQVYESSIVVGYTAKGKAITKVDLKERVKVASARVKAGDFIAHEDIEKEVENW